MIRIAIAAACLTFGTSVYGQMNGPAGSEGTARHSGQRLTQDANQKGIVSSPSPMPALYSGCYYSGFELNSFSPAGTRDSWSVDWAVDRTILDKLAAEESGPRPRLLRAYIVVRGRLSEEGRFGHMGGHKRQITVANVISARKPLPEDQCAEEVVSKETLYRQGLAMERDGQAAEAVRMYRRAARAGSGKAARRLGEIFHKGRPGVPEDHAESRLWYRTARQLGESVP